MPGDVITSTVHEQIVSYTPNRDVLRWPVIADFMRSWVRDANPLNARQAQEFMMIGTRFIDWCVGERGLDLDHDLIDPAFAEAFLHDWGQTRAAVTRNIGRRHLHDLIRRTAGGALPPGGNTAAIMPSGAYTDAEIARMYSWANGRTSPATRRTSLTLLTLMLGFGLPVADVVLVQRSDVTEPDDGGLLLHVDGRHIWCDTNYEPQMRRLIAELDQDSWLLPYRRSSQVQTFMRNAKAQRLGGDGLVPKLKRLRTTWFVHRAGHFNALVAVMRAYGITHTHTLQSVLPHIPAPSDAETRRVLRERIL